MPASDADSDAASNAAATKVQAILRGSAARKTAITKSAASAGEVRWSTGGGLKGGGWNGIGGEGGGDEVALVATLAVSWMEWDRR